MIDGPSGAYLPCAALRRDARVWEGLGCADDATDAERIRFTGAVKGIVADAVAVEVRTLIVASRQAALVSSARGCSTRDGCRLAGEYIGLSGAVKLRARCAGRNGAVPVDVCTRLRLDLPAHTDHGQHGPHCAGRASWHWLRGKLFAAQNLTAVLSAPAPPAGSSQTAAQAAVARTDAVLRLAAAGLLAFL